MTASNPFEPLAELLEKHITQLADQGIDENIGQGVFPAQYRERGRQVIIESWHIFADYLRNRQIEPTRVQMLTANTDIQSLGVSLENYQRGVEINFNKAKELVERTYPGPINQPRREMFLRRLDGLQTMGIVGAVNNQLTQRQNNGSKK